MILEIAAGGYLIGSLAYHRWFEDPPPKPKPARSIDIPRTDEGAQVPLIFGRCKVRAPWLAYVGTPAAAEGGGEFEYRIDMLFVLGISFVDDANNHLHFIYVDDNRLVGADFGPDGLELVGNGGFETPGVVGGDPPTNGGLGGVGTIGQLVEFLNGNSAQELTAPESPWAASTRAGQRMAAKLGSGALVPGFRGYLSVFLWNTVDGWAVGNDPRPGNYSFECSSYLRGIGEGLGGRLHQSLLGTSKVGEEANPADVIRNLVVATRGKLGAFNRVDDASFAAAAQILLDEEHGYSRAVENMDQAGDVIDEVLRQIDGILYEDTETGTFKLKLVRDDYDPLTVLEINPSNCEALESFHAGGRINLTNKVRAVFTNRQHEYRDDSVSAQNHANAVGQDGVINEIVLRYPGVCTAENASAICSRELQARSRPIQKFRAVVDRTLVRVAPGDVVRLTWPEYELSDMFYRVVAADKGERDSSKIRIDIIQEFFAIHRFEFATNDPIDPFPVGGL